MVFSLTVLAQDSAMEAAIARDLETAAKGLMEVRAECASRQKEFGQVLFVDERMSSLASVLDGIDRRGKAVFLIVRERPGQASEVPQPLADGLVDEVLVHPFRPLEVLSKLRHYQQILMWDEVMKLNASFSDLLNRLHDDLRLAERLQKSRVPVRFPEIRGFKVMTRYLAGMRSGGDHFDLAESRDGSLITTVLSDSSSYGLSSAILTVLMKVAMKLSADESRSSADTVRRIQEELQMTLGPKDRLSLFYGVVSRKDYRLKYINLGTSCAFYAPPAAGFQALPASGTPITQSGGAMGGEAELLLEPEGRLVLLSDGFVETMHGLDPTLDLLDRFRDKERVELLNELAFRVKSTFTEDDDMPAQDCTAAIFDIDSKIIRLTRN